MIRVATAATALLALYPTPFQTRVHAQEQGQEESAEQLDDDVRPRPSLHRRRRAAGVIRPRPV